MSYISNNTNYYPFGWEMPGRDMAHTTGATDYRNGYQGQFSEYDVETGYNDFTLRSYDPRIARWTTTDPYRQHFSPYLAMGNNPINRVDPDGGYWYTGGMEGQKKRRELYWAYRSGYNPWMSDEDKAAADRLIRFLAQQHVMIQYAELGWQDWSTRLRNYVGQDMAEEYIAEYGETATLQGALQDMYEYSMAYEWDVMNVLEGIYEDAPYLNGFSPAPEAVVEIGDLTLSEGYKYTGSSGGVVRFSRLAK